MRCYTPILLTLLASVAACAADTPEISDLENPGDPDASGKADGFEDNLVAELTEKYGVRPRRYLGFWDGSNEAERRFIAHLPVVTAELNEIAAARGRTFTFTEAELATSMITEGGYFLLADDIAEGYIDGFFYLGVDTFFDNRAALDPWLTNELYVYLANAEANGIEVEAEAVNELGQTVTSIVVDTIEQGIEANAVMFAWMREIAAGDFAELGHDFDAVDREGQFYWTTIYYNAGPGFGRKRLVEKGPDYWRAPYTGPEENRYASFNVAWRTATFEHIDRMKYR